MLTVKTKFRLWLGLFMLGLVLSGLTAVPLVWEVSVLNRMIGTDTFMETLFTPLAAWITRVHDGLIEIGEQQPYMLYGTDWLAFGHVMIAVAFLGPLKDPLHNKWLIDFGIIACIAVIPVALIMGPVRGIPFFWRLIDCSFGVFGIIPLLICRHYIRLMERTG